MKFRMANRVPASILHSPEIHLLFDKDLVDIGREFQSFFRKVDVHTVMWFA